MDLRWKVEYNLTACCFLFMHLTIWLQLFNFLPSLHTWYSISEKHLKIVLLFSFINMSKGATARTKQVSLWKSYLMRAEAPHSPDLPFADCHSGCHLVDSQACSNCRFACTLAWWVPLEFFPSLIIYRGVWKSQILEDLVTPSFSIYILYNIHTQMLL